MEKYNTLTITQIHNIANLKEDERIIMKSMRKDDFFVNKEGKYLVRRGCLLHLRLPNGKEGYLRSDGSLVCVTFYDKATYIPEINLIHIKEGSREGLVSTYDGRMLVGLFDHINVSADDIQFIKRYGLIMVESNGKVGYMSKYSSKVVSGRLYDSISFFSKKYYYVMDGEKKGFLKNSGKLVGGELFKYAVYDYERNCPFVSNTESTPPPLPAYEYEDYTSRV